MGGTIITGMVCGLCALVMIVIGVRQTKSEKPVGFYTGKTPPGPTEITDVQAWNQKHGRMWILYGVGFVLSFVLGLCLPDENKAAIALAVLTVVPIPLMMLYHKKLEETYLKK